MTTKRCSKCRLIKNISEFGPDTSHRDGLQSWCNSCQNAQKQQARQTPVSEADSNAPRYLHNKGYIWVKHGPGCVLEHRLVMDVLNQPDLHVHHINGDKTDNRPENLQVMSDSEHMRVSRLEQSQARIREDGHIHCTMCKQYKPPNQFYVASGSSINLRSRCNVCKKDGDIIERNKILAKPVNDGLSMKFTEYLNEH